MSIEVVLRTELRKVSLFPEQVDTLGLHDSLFVSGILDSLGLVWLISLIEQEFHLSIPLEEISLDQFGTLAGIIAFIEQSEEREHIL